ncbi:MAG: malto-oligosyltrehalose synthase [Candidatus Rokubacteria bacterium]|nr:malto-oligosyltrehalose synthase [Candidatus Rokubacteria bacterium]
MIPERVFELFHHDPGAFRRIPVSTYRIQLAPSCTFGDVREIVPYLAALGVTDCYLSPLFQPCSKQSHGYDIADHNRLNEALGTEADFQALTDALRAHGMGLVLDVVPNHMGIGGDRNAWWLDVLENGQASPYAHFFDIDWDPVKPELKNKVLLPVLGDQYGLVLENQGLVLEFREGSFVVRYHNAVLPIAPRTYVHILRLRLNELEKALGKEHPHLLELQSIITALTHLPPQTETDPEHLAERYREKEIVKRRLQTLTQESPVVKAFLEENVRLLNGTKGDPRSFDHMDELLSAQAYRVAFWQVAGDEINYRRFFDINELAAIRMEEPAVFEEAHRMIFRLIGEGRVTGLRIDHPDGLYAPAHYFKNLQRRCFVEVARRLAGGEADAERKRWEEAVLAEFDRRVGEHPDSPLARPFYIVAEKILMPDERLPAGWPVHGTTGYDFLNALNGLFVDVAGERAMDETYGRLVGGGSSFHEVVYESKKLIMETTMSGEIGVLGHRLARISDRDRASRDFTGKSLTDALREIIACFPVYRTYIGEDGVTVSERDRRYVEQAVAMARWRNPTVSGSIFDFIRDLLLLRSPEGLSEDERRERLTFVQRFQQLTAPITAKGVEDTALYRYNRLVSLNEVGSSPDRFGLPVAEFHRRNAERRARWPWSLSATATHDTKRGEGVRAAIDVLSEIPHEWRVHLRQWRRLNKRKKTMVDGQPAPDANEEYLLYQTLLGAWPREPLNGAAYAEFCERIQQYMFKALREAKVHLSWLNPRPDYDEAVRRFVAVILDGSGENPFLDDFVPFQRKIAGWGMYNSLSQTLLKLAAPGVPDLYQGTEVWDLSLVDPDNRRPVDYARRRQMLADLLKARAQAGTNPAALARQLTETKEDGRIKLYLIHRILTYRREHPRLFLDGDYVPLEAAGPRRDHLCAFARRTDTETVLAVAPRSLARLSPEGPPLGEPVWGETSLIVPAAPAKPYRNLLTGESVEVFQREGRPALALPAVFRNFPVALLEQEP